MTYNLKTRLDDAISILEHVSAFERRSRLIFDWAGLSGGQRMIAIVINVLSFQQAAAPTVQQIAEVTGLTSDRLRTVFDNMEHAPYALATSREEGERFYASQTLQYGKPGNESSSDGSRGRG